MSFRRELNGLTFRRYRRLKILEFANTLEATPQCVSEGIQPNMFIWMSVGSELDGLAPR